MRVFRETNEYDRILETIILDDGHEEFEIRMLSEYLENKWRIKSEIEEKEILLPKILLKYNMGESI
jgi:hypothetical protein